MLINVFGQWINPNLVVAVRWKRVERDAYARVVFSGLEDDLFFHSYKPDEVAAEINRLDKPWIGVDMAEPRKIGDGGLCGC